MGHWERGVNRLRHLLASIFPALERAFDYSNRSPLILLSGYSTPAQLREITPDASPLGCASTWRGRPVSPPWSTTPAPPQPSRASFCPPRQRPLIGRHAQQLLDLDRETKNLGKEIAARFAEHPHATPITSVRGFGPLLGAELLAATGGDLPTAFGNPGRLAAYAGLAPVPRDSGRIRAATCTDALPTSSTATSSKINKGD